MATVKFTTWILGLALAVGALSAHAELMVPYSKFASWPKAKQEKYIKDVTKIAADFELNTQKGVKIALLETPWFQFPALIESAYAAPGQYCLIGGRRRPLKPNAQGTLVCPPNDPPNPCEPYGAAGFTCGSIYNDKCIQLEPKDSITKRCLEAAGNAIPTRERYEARRQALETLAAGCRSGEIKAGWQCNDFLRRFALVEKAYSSGAATGDDGWTTVESGAVAAEPPGQGVPSIESLGGTTEVVTAPANPETCEKPPCPIIVETPEQPVKPPKEVVTPTPEPPKDDCMARNKTKLGELACIACGMEEWNPADVLTQGGGVTKWVALLGIMAQTYHDGYNIGNATSLDHYKARVIEMVSTYGYCTDNEYQPMHLPNNSRDWIDGSSTLREKGPQQSEFANGFGLMSNKRGGLFQSSPEYTSRPMTLPKQIFDEGRNWTSWNPQKHQWRFRSMIHAHYRSYPGTAFSNCAERAEARMKNLSSLKMCPLIEDTWPNGGLRHTPSKKFGPEEFGQNERFYKKLVTRCNVKTPRVITDYNCDNRCWHSDAHKHAVAEMPYCTRGPDPGCTSGCDHGKPDEPEHPRGDGGSDGSSDGSSDGGKGGEPGDGRGPGDGSPSDGSGKGGEGGNSTR